MTTMTSFSRKASDALADWAPLPIRLAVGYGLMAHGYAKLSRGPETFAVVLHKLGVPDPLFAAWAATLTELIGGAAVYGGRCPFPGQHPDGGRSPDGARHRASSLRLLLGEFEEVATKTGIKFGSVGYEILLLYLAGVIALVLGGPGALSLERWLERRRDREQERQTLQSLARKP